MKTLTPAVTRVPERLHYPLDVILTCVCRCVAYPLDLRHLKEMKGALGSMSIARRSSAGHKQSFTYRSRAFSRDRIFMLNDSIFNPRFAASRAEDPNRLVKD